MSEGWGLKGNLPIESYWIFLAFSLIKRSRCCSNEHSYRVACVVGKNVYCIDDILPKKEKKISKKMYFSL